MGDTFAQLEAQYCPPLDPALLSAILSDYDLGDQQDLANAKNTLNELKESALQEEQAGFDPSGTGGIEDDGASRKHNESFPDSSASQSRETDATSESNQLSSLSLEDDRPDHGAAAAESVNIEKQDHATKIQLLQDVLGERVNRYSIDYTLKKCNGRWNAALEELLNHVYFGETAESDQDGDVISVKGIDGFSEENVVRRGRRNKTKNKRPSDVDQMRSISLPTTDGVSHMRTKNKWESAVEEVDFITIRTGIARTTVSSKYYETGASVPQTIGALLKSSMEGNSRAVMDDAEIAMQTVDLGRDFPSIAPHYITALVRLTYPSTVAAHELANALTAKPKDTDNGAIQIIPQYARPIGIEDESGWNAILEDPRSSTSSWSPSSDAPSAAVRRDAYALARAAALSKANAARRKAKSDHLMGGAAAYYGEISREYAALSSQSSAAAADELAASQSTYAQLDLHGIDVANGVRIAKEKVEEWWDSLGESRINGRLGAQDRQAGYRIVVGLGRHSEGGKGKLGPAVSKALRQEGWRVESAGPVIVVKGT